MGAMTKFATETAKLMKSFAETTKNDEEAQQDFCNELADSSEETQSVLKLLFAAAEKEMSSLRRSEKSSSKNNAKDNGGADSKERPMTKKEQAVEILISGQAISKKQIQNEVVCDRKTVDRAIKEIEKKGKIITTTKNNELQVT